MKFSIIIPNRSNCSKLRKCIDSVEKSRIKDYEIIIIDDYSDDFKINKYYSDILSNRIHIFFNEKNKEF